MIITRLAYKVYKCFSTIECRIKRQMASPFNNKEGHFGRNFKNDETHINRIEKAIRRADLKDYVKIVPAFDNLGNVSNKKIALYFANNESESLFYQYYTIVKNSEQ